MKALFVMILGGLVFLFNGCSNPPADEHLTTAKTPSPAAPKQDVTAPDFYQGDLSWQNVEFILHSSSVGRIVTIGDEYPYSVPVSFAYFEGKVVVHSSAKGTKIGNIKKDQRVCFAVDRFNEREGWASINFFGKANIVSDAAKKGELMAKFGPAYDLPPGQVDSAVSKASGKPMEMPIVMIEIIPDKITNRLLSVPKSWLIKFPYITGAIPGEPVLPTGAHGGSTKEMPKELIDWTLYSCSAGRLNTFAADYPNSTPVNYTYFDHKIYIHSRNHGAKFDNLKQNPKVSFSVDRFNQVRWLSVNIAGTARLINEPNEMALLMQKYTVAFNTTEIDKIPEAVDKVKSSEGMVADSMKRMSARMVLIEITPAEITGRMNNVKLNVAKLPYTLQDSLLITPMDSGDVH